MGKYVSPNKIGLVKRDPNNVALTELSRSELVLFDDDAKSGKLVPNISVMLSELENLKTMKRELA